ncbi:hypothetical protein DPMN_169345 [Dreissena polymorpha]|uniref:Uncharacterized protein n=1 Tax=Dreissena polymorpha TaxID=45954 RepID=A0A9D4DVT9_DREPO|nr:hypothetical protein DPMN_169345 [Dreissena polymorpha]
MLENEQGKYGERYESEQSNYESATNQYDITTDPLRSSKGKYELERSATKQLELRRTGTDRQERTTIEHCPHSLLCCHTQKPSQKENMQAAATARNRNNGISRVLGRVYLLHPKPRPGLKSQSLIHHLFFLL